MKTNPQHKSLRAISASCAILLALGALLNIGLAPVAHAETLLVSGTTNTNDPVTNELQMKGISLGVSGAAKTDLYAAIQVACSEFPGDADTIIASVFTSRPADVIAASNTAFLQGVVKAAILGIKGTDVPGVYNTTTVNTVALAAANFVSPLVYASVSGTTGQKDIAAGKAIGDIAQTAIANSPMPSTDAVTIATYLAANVTGLTVIEKSYLAGHSIKAFLPTSQATYAASLTTAVGTGITTLADKEIYSLNLITDTATTLAEQIVGATAALGGITHAEAYAFNRYLMNKSAASVAGASKALATIAISGTNGDTAAYYAEQVTTGTGAGITTATRTSVVGGVAAAAPASSLAVANAVAAIIAATPGQNTDLNIGGVYAAAAKGAVSLDATVLTLSQAMYSTGLLNTEAKKLTFSKKMVDAVQTNSTSVEKVVGDALIYAVPPLGDYALYANNLTASVTSAVVATKAAAVQAIAKQVALSPSVTDKVLFATNLTALTTAADKKGWEAAGVAVASPANAVLIAHNIALSFTNPLNFALQNTGRTTITAPILTAVSGSAAAIVSNVADLIVSDNINTPATDSTIIGLFAGGIAKSNLSLAATIASTLDTKFSYSTVADESALAGQMVKVFPTSSATIQAVVQALIEPGFTLGDKELYTKNVAAFATTTSEDVAKSVALTLANDGTRQTFAAALAALTPSSTNVASLMSGVMKASTAGTGPALALAITTQLKTDAHLTKAADIIGAIAAVDQGQVLSIVSQTGGLFVTGSSVANVTATVTQLKSIVKATATAVPTSAATIATTAIALLPATTGAGSSLTVDKGNKALVAGGVISAFVTLTGVVTNSAQIINVVNATAFLNTMDDTLYAIKVATLVPGSAAVVVNRLATITAAGAGLASGALETFAHNVIVGAAAAGANIAKGATQRAITNGVTAVTFATNVAASFTAVQSTMIQATAAGAAMASPTNAAGIVYSVLGNANLLTDANRIAVAKAVAVKVATSSSEIAYQAAGRIAVGSYPALGNAIATGVATLLTPVALVADDLGAIAAVLVLKARQNAGTDSDVANIIAQIVKVKPALAYDIVGAGLAASESITASPTLQTAITNAINALALTAVPSGSVAAAMANFTSGKDLFVDVTYADGALIPHVTIVHPS